MPPAPNSARHSISPAWALLLLFPAALLAGWVVGGLPVTAPRPPVATSTASVPIEGARPEVPAAPKGLRVDVSLFEASGPTGALGEVSSWTTLADAIAQSERNGKPILIDFNAEWCGPCRRMQQDVFDDGTLGQAVRTAVIPVSVVDRKAEEGRNSPEVEDLQNRYRVDAFPTLVVFSPKTGRSAQTRGYGGAQPTLEWIEQAARSVR